MEAGLETGRVLSSSNYPVLDVIFWLPGPILHAGFHILVVLSVLAVLFWLSYSDGIVHS
jgi:hypothetical protein